MRKSFILLFAGLVCAGIAAGGYSHTVSGKVYFIGTGTPVSSATVTLSVEWSSGMWSSGSTITQNDGSFTFSTTSDSDYKGKTMKLKATKGLLIGTAAGSTTWVCSSYSENKDVWISSQIQINPNLSVELMPSNFAFAGPQAGLTTAAYLDDPASGTVLINHFLVTLFFDASVMNCAGVSPSPGSPFFIQYFIDGNRIGVEGFSEIPVPLFGQDTPQSFFDVFFDVFTVGTPSYTSVIVEEKSALYSPMSTAPLYPYPHRTDILLGEPIKAAPGLYIDGYEEWGKALKGQMPDPAIRPMSMTRWEQYIGFWRSPQVETEGQPYPETQFVPCDETYGSGMLYPWADDGSTTGGISGDGLVMAWMQPTQTWPSGNYASAWEFDYGWDPDLTNCTIQVTVTPPAPPAGSKSHINAVSFSIVDITGKMRTWWWAVPAAIPLGVSTTVKINTALVGVAAATPVATGYMNVPGFDLTQSQFFNVDENFQYIFGQQVVPPPGQQQFMAWNYWHWLMVTKNTTAHKWFYIKYSQPPVVIDSGNPPKIQGWDEKSVYWPPQYPVMADDWPCKDERPITDIHWWGSFIGWTKPYLPPVLPKAFHIGIWTDVPVGPGNLFSHPGKLIWENYCTSWVWNFAGYDVDPRPEPLRNEACFQFTQLLNENQWFYQKPLDDAGKPNIYWLSIAAVYDPASTDLANIYPWGWKTRIKKFNDNAVEIFSADIWPIKLGSTYQQGQPVTLPSPIPEMTHWDLAFELSTNAPKIPASADLNYSGFVDLADFALFAQQWLTTQP